MKSFFYLFVTLLVSLSSCNGCKDDCTGSLQFDLPLQAYGIKDTLYLGDTLRVKLAIPDKLTERFSGREYDFVDYNFKLVTYIGRIDTLPTGTDSKGTFDWTTLQGESQYFGNVFIVHLSYSDHTYHYEVLITPKRKGLFIFGMNSDFGNTSPLEKLDGPCSKEPVEVFMKLENDTNTNFEFLQLSPEPVYKNLNRQRFDEFAGFCFFVR